MKVIVSGKNIRLTERLRSFSEERLASLQRYFDHILEVDVILSVEKHKTIENSHKAEVQVWANGGSFKAKCAAGDMYAAINGAGDKLERQLKKYKEKLKENRHKNGPSPPTVPAVDVNQMTHSVVQLATERTAKGKTASPKIVRSRGFAAKPMSIEEAAEQLSSLKQDFVVFSNAETNEVNVVYRRADGNVGLIEPSFK